MKQLLKSKLNKLALVIFPLLISCAYVADASTMTFPGVPNIPLAKNLSFDGFFKEHQPVKIVWGIGQPGAQTTESLWNCALVIKYLAAHNYHYKIHIVFYSKGDLVADMFSSKYSSWGPLLRTLHKDGVTFTVCHNAMYLFHIHKNDLYPFVKPIPAGILSLVEYEMRGYMPIYNPNSVSK